MASRPTPRASIRVLTTDGLQFLPALSNAQAATVGGHWNALRRYLDFGDEAPLRAFVGITVVGRTLETDLEVIEWHAIRGDVRFESIYDEVV